MGNEQARCRYYQGPCYYFLCHNHLKMQFTELIPVQLKQPMTIQCYCICKDTEKVKKELILIIYRLSLTHHGMTYNFLTLQYLKAICILHKPTVRRILTFSGLAICLSWHSISDEHGWQQQVTAPSKSHSHKTKTLHSRLCYQYFWLTYCQDKTNHKSKGLCILLNLTAKIGAFECEINKEQLFKCYLPFPYKVFKTFVNFILKTPINMGWHHFSV